LKVAWFTLEDLGVLLRRLRADTVTKAIARVLRADLVVVDLCRARDYAEGSIPGLVAIVSPLGSSPCEPLAMSA